ncbi:putative YeeE/YedE family protein [Paratrimastix pyriformis]|uniref:YeeE/YedE family protein n=1 Tax=Paratrimastix pyriformis TaxID=342808 RepID=A0ABQ8U5N7_9EUKA|nr:putative YeeE/YedE family protein [Paratrimastix pyriformis]
MSSWISPNFTFESAGFASLGGAMLGIAVAALLFFNGKLAGISGIVSGILIPGRKAITAPSGEKKEVIDWFDVAWRAVFMFGLILAGFIMRWGFPAFSVPRLVQFPTSGVPLWRMILAGVLVGFGVKLGNGCTSGHGICGISRLSKRSFVATGLFMLFGMISTLIFYNL